MRRRTIVYVLVGATVAVGLGTWISVRGSSGSPAQTESAGPPEQPAANPPKSAPVLTVSVVHAQRKTLDDKIHVVGMTVPREDVVVIPEATGLRIREIYAEVGDVVRKGQRLASLDSQSLRIQLQGLQTEFERTRDEYSNLKSMQPSGAVSREALAARRAAFEVAQSRLQDAELGVHRTVIVAPTSGLVYERSAAIGGLTNGSEPLFRLARDGEVEVAVSVPEAMVRRLEPAMPATLEIAGHPAPLTGEVRLITPRVNTVNRSTDVRIRFKRDGFTPVGVFCEASITVARVGGWVLPGTALQQDTQGEFVWSVSPESSVMRKPVTVIIRTPESVVVKDALGNAPIVARAGSFLKEGDLIAVKATDLIAEIKGH